MRLVVRPAIRFRRSALIHLMSRSEPGRKECLSRDGCARLQEQPPAVLDGGLACAELGGGELLRTAGGFEDVHATMATAKAAHRAAGEKVV